MDRKQRLMNELAKCKTPGQVAARVAILAFDLDKLNGTHPFTDPVLIAAYNDACQAEADYAFLQEAKAHSIEARHD